MITDLVVQSAERVVNQRRCVVHLLQDLLAAIDGFVDLKTVPPAKVVSKDLVCRKIEFKYCPCACFTSSGKHLRHQIREHAEKENYEYRDVRNDQKRRNNAERDHILSFL